MARSAVPLEVGDDEAGQDQCADGGEGHAEDGSFGDDAFDAADAGLGRWWSWLGAILSFLLRCGCIDYSVD